MKKLFILPVLLSLLFVTSCNNNNSGIDAPDIYTYATVRETDAVEDGIYFELDTDDTFYVNLNLSKTDLSDLTIGERVIVGIDYSKSEIADFDYVADLYQVLNVIEGECTTVSSESEDEAIANDQLVSMYSSISLSYNYLNTYITYSSNNASNAKFYLVYVMYEKEAEEVEDYVNFELRYDNGNSGTGEETSTSEYLSFDVSAYRQLLLDKKGINLKIDTELSGEIWVTIDSDNLFE
ncbi:MAG: NigD-like C-terminal domain-containing protein [Rikenellaceae bacterium]